jgi:hypothetical protein
MPRVPTVQQVTPLSPQRSDAPQQIQRTAQQVGNLGAAGFDLATAQLEADFNKEFATAKADHVRRANELQLELAEDDGDPLLRSAKFDQSFADFSRDRLAAIPNARVREEVEASLPSIADPVRFNVQRLANARHQEIGLTESQTALDEMKRTAIATENPLEFAERTADIFEMIDSNGFIDAEDKPELARASVAEVEAGRIVHLAQQARESGTLEDFDGIRDLVAETEFTTAEQKTKLTNFVEAMKTTTRKETTEGLVLGISDGIRDAETSEELDREEERVRAAFEDNLLLEGMTNGLIDRIENKRKTLAKTDAAFARVELARKGIAMNHDDKKDQDAVDLVWKEEVLPLYEEDREAADQAELELFEATQVIGPTRIGQMKAASQTNNPDVLAEAALRYDRFKQAAPEAVQDQMTGVEFENITLMSTLMKGNTPPEQAFRMIKELRQTPKDAIETLDVRLTEERKDNTTKMWLEDNRDRFETDTPGIFGGIDFDGTFPAEFVAVMDAKVRLKYIARSNQNTGDPRPLDWAREQAMNEALVTWGTTNVGAQKGQLVFRPPEKSYRRSVAETGGSDAIERDLIDSVLSEAHVGINGPRVSGAAPEPITAPEQARIDRDIAKILRQEAEDERDIDEFTVESLSLMLQSSDIILRETAQNELAKRGVSIEAGVPTPLTPEARDVPVPKGQKDPGGLAASERNLRAVREASAPAVQEVLPGVSAEPPSGRAQGGLVGVGAAELRARLGTADKGEREALGNRILLKVDSDSVSRVDDGGQPAMDYVVFLLDENRENPQMLFDANGNPFRWEHVFEETEEFRETAAERHDQANAEIFRRKLLKSVLTSALPPMSREEFNKRAKRIGERVQSGRPLQR